MVDLHRPKVDKRKQESNSQSGGRTEKCAEGARMT